MAEQKKVHFEILNLDALVDSNLLYFDDGFVDSLAKHYLELCKMYERLPDRSIVTQLSNPNIQGNTWECIFNPFKHQYTFLSSSMCEKHIRIWYKHLLEHKAILTRAHEESHALQFMGQLHLIEKKLAERYNLALDLGSLDCEVSAEVGGIYALLERKIDPKGFQVNGNYEKALKLFPKKAYARRSWFSRIFG